MRAALRMLWRVARVYLMVVGACATLGVVCFSVLVPIDDGGDRGQGLARVQLRKMCDTLDLYLLDNRHYPTTEQGLEALVRRPSVEPIPTHYMVGGYAREGDLIDPWGTPLSYELEAGRPVVRIVGAPDGKAIVGCWIPDPML